MEGVQSEKKTDAYERFGRDVKRMNTQDPLQTAEELLRKSLNIKFEWSVLMEAQNLIDQLQIMQEIFTQQITVMGDFEKALKAMSSESQGPSDLKPALARAAALIEDMKLRRDELWNLEKRQANTRSQVTVSYHIVIADLGILTAIAAAARTPRHEATAVGNYRGQGRHPQGRRERCARQIDCRLHRGDHFLRKLTCPPHCPPLYYSLVTRVLTSCAHHQLPLSFFATFFGMNAQELNEGYMRLSTQLVYMCEFLEQNTDFCRYGPSG